MNPCELRINNINKLKTSKKSEIITYAFDILDAIQALLLFINQSSSITY